MSPRVVSGCRLTLEVLLGVLRLFEERERKLRGSADPELFTIRLLTTPSWRSRYYDV